MVVGGLIAKPKYTTFNSSRSCCSLTVGATDGVVALTLPLVSAISVAIILIYSLFLKKFSGCLGIADLLLLSSSLEADIK
jgi:hypothetical protein